MNDFVDHAPDLRVVGLNDRLVKAPESQVAERGSLAVVALDRASDIGDFEFGSHRYAPACDADMASARAWASSMVDVGS